ncbi:hypothetical protein EJ02DRAFT_175352 [Clathrospora elynae]|uniref:SUN domain-containing protein n=1 Tax=Clathrospora elynae TaxID=706981 RepID=A0A6A5T3F5_9PLEO|nr:hypothetical protein EJ02DRAFT_175352 [Clathrospora elynae]
MPTIGAPLRKWTLFLLLCSIPPSALAATANETAIADSSATAQSGATTQQTSSPATSPTSSPSIVSLRRYSDTETTSPYRTINYITHTLPQQCAKTSWSAPGEAAPTNGTTAEAGAIPTPQAHIPGIRGGTESIKDEQGSTISTIASQAEASASTHSTTSSDTPSAEPEPEPELETDSPFDNANFLSFDEWKKKNLEQVGQSPENVGQGRAAASNQPARRRPVNVNALDSLGDEGEIEIDFSGFGTSEGKNVANNIQSDKHIAKAKDGNGKAAPSSWTRSKDAVKTCKERFNYASFDCAATVLKTNKQAKSSSSVLVENKDSYMLNECSADNKFLIVELCDDILVDTIALANYEFFSSMFRHFRVSVSDRYPVKMERWRTLGTFEARNSRDIQPFLITEPQIWARYLRVEFLTHFGNEYYCPLSLLRVHGTTMMEQFRREEEEAGGIDDDDGDLEAEGVHVTKSAVDSGPLPPDEIPIEALKVDNASSQAPAVTETASPSVESNSIEQPSRLSVSSTGPAAVGSHTGQSTDTPQSQISSTASSVSSPSPESVRSKGGEANVTAIDDGKSSNAPSATNKAEVSPQTQSSASNASVVSPSPPASRNDSAPSLATNATSSGSSSRASTKSSSNSTVANPQVQSQTRGSSTQPNAPVPSTQESFFKSIHKRLLHLEANSTLSLQYIEEQSRILRDAFVKVEKRQLAKTEKFLDHLNSTVMVELKSFRNMYDQLWQSTVIELESIKERQKSEMGEIGARLSLMADELVWQKRMAVVQSTLLLLCLGLVLFVRSGTLGAAADVPIVQRLGNKYTSFFELSPPRSPPDTSGMARRRSTFRNMWKSDTSVLSDHQSDGQHALSDAETDGLRSPVQIEYSPPTPDTPVTRGSEKDHLSLRVNGVSTVPIREQENEPPTPTSPDQAARIQVLETQSGPATPNGTRDSRPSWEEVDRAMDLLKIEEQEQGQRSPPTQSKKKKEDSKKKKRSPLRRAQSSYDATP